MTGGMSGVLAVTFAISMLPVVVLLLFLASFVAIAVSHVRIPYTVALVFVGVMLAALGAVPTTALSPELVLDLLLPPLLFEAAFALRWKPLARMSFPVSILATFGVAVSAIVGATVLVVTAGLPWSLALLFGVLVAATDPVAVVAFFQNAQVAPELRALVEGESLLNDGIAVVLVGVLGELTVGSHLDPVLVLRNLVWVAVGGLVVGGVVGLAGSLLARGTSDYLVEATVSVATAYGSYLIAEQLHVSGVLAVVATGSVFGNFGRRFGLSRQTEESIDLLWRFFAFIANSLVFLLLGSAVVPSALVQLGPLIGLGVVAALLGRAVAAYGLGGLLAAVTKSPPLAWRHVLFWGGLRGALPVVVAIAVSEKFQLDPLLHELVLSVVLVTLFIQGITLQPVLARALAPAHPARVPDAA